MATFKRNGDIHLFRDKFVAGIWSTMATTAIPQHAASARSKDLKPTVFPKATRRASRRSLRLGLDQMLLPRGLRLRPAQQPADGVLRASADCPRRARARGRGAPGRYQPQSLGLHLRTGGERKMGAAPRLASDKGNRRGGCEAAHRRATMATRIRECCGGAAVSAAARSSASPKPTPSDRSGSIAGARCGPRRHSASRPLPLFAAADETPAPTSILPSEPAAWWHSAVDRRDRADPAAPRQR